MEKENPIRPFLMGIRILLFFLSLNHSAQKKSVSYVSTRLSAQQAIEINPELLSKPWSAKWISYPDNSNTDYGVFLFRKEILINTKPDKFIVHVSADKAKIVSTLLNDGDLAQCTLYFKFYLFEALEKAGQVDQFTASLTPWEKMVDTGLTTFAETPDPTRSDCHAWSASPVYYFLTLVSGIKPNAPGFKSVRIEPNFGGLKNIDATMPHKLGIIHVTLQKDKNSLRGEITLPSHLDGIFLWNGVQSLLKGGINNINFPVGNSKQ